MYVQTCDNVRTHWSMDRSMARQVYTSTCACANIRHCMQMHIRSYLGVRTRVHTCICTVLHSCCQLPVHAFLHWSDIPTGYPHIPETATVLQKLDWPISTAHRTRSTSYQSIDTMLTLNPNPSDSFLSLL